MFPLSAFFRSHALRFTTISSIDGAATALKTNLMVDYFINSLQFSKQDAIAAASKVTHLKSTINSDLVVNILKNYGLDIAQIRDIVFSAPTILTCNANKTLEPKIRVFQELGLSAPDIVILIKRNPKICTYALHTRIMPGLEFLRKLVGSDEKVVQVINRSGWLRLSNSYMRRLSENVSLLRNYGLPDERIVKFIVRTPGKLRVDPRLLEGKLDYVEKKLGISRESHSFIYGLYVILSHSDLKIEKKMDVFRSFGWSDSEISLLFKSQPFCLTKSEATIRDKLKFFMNDLGFTPSYLTRYTYFFTFSLEKRVKPRNVILKILKEKRLVDEKLPLATVVCHTELKFLDFLRRFENALPGLHETYLNSLKGIPKAE